MDDLDRAFAALLDHLDKIPEDYPGAVNGELVAAARAALERHEAAPAPAGEPWGWVLHLPDDLYGYCYTSKIEAQEAADALDLVGHEFVPVYRNPPAAPQGEEAPRE